MKKLVIIALILMTSVVFAQKRGMGKGNKMGPNSMKKLTIEERFQKRTERKYTKIKKRLTKKNADKLIAILKKYDKRIFALMKPHLEKKQELKKAEYADFKAQIKFMEEGLELKQKVLKIKKEEFKELKNSGLSNRIIAKVMKKELRHGMKGHKKGKRHGKRHGKMKGNMNQDAGCPFSR